MKVGIVMVSVSLALASPALCEAKEHDLEFEAPSLLEPGTPVGAQYTGNGQIQEVDPFDNDDVNGGSTEADDKGENATGQITITEDETGDLIAPDGEDLNGGTEGDCIELRCCFEYRYMVTITKAGSAKIGETGVEGRITVRVWAYGTNYSDVQVLCPGC